MAQLDRITRDPTVMGGKPCIRGMRVTVGMIVGQIGAGHTIKDPGGLAEFIAIPAVNAVSVHSQLEPVQAVLTEPLACW
jgi:threonine dehydrogenase-like Zn-dependent dehydrogenase